MQTAQSHLSHKAVKTNKICWNGKNPATMKGCSPIQPSTFVGHISTSPRMWKDIKRKPFPSHCRSNCASPPKKSTRVLCPPWKSWRRLINILFVNYGSISSSPFLVLQLSGDNGNFHPSLMGIDQCHPMRYWKPSHSQPFWKERHPKKSYESYETIIASLKTQQPANHPFQNPWYGTFSSRFFSLPSNPQRGADFDTGPKGKAGEWTPQQTTLSHKILVASNSRNLGKNYIVSTKSHLFPNRTVFFWKVVFEVAVFLLFKTNQINLTIAKTSTTQLNCSNGISGFFWDPWGVWARSQNCQPIYPLNYSKILNPPKQKRCEDPISTPKKNEINEIFATQKNNSTQFKTIPVFFFTRWLSQASGPP